MQLFIPFIVAIGVGGWVYAQLMRSSGGNSQSALTVAGIVAAGVFVVLFMLARTYLSY